MTEQQGDIRLFQTVDNGDIEVKGGLVGMHGGLETAVYLSLFGGNLGDDGLRGNTLGWWANIDETDPYREYHSEAQNLLVSLPATSGNLRRIEDAAVRDLAWITLEKVASRVGVSASIPGLNIIKLNINIEARGEESSLEFVETWRSGA